MTRALLFSLLVACGGGTQQVAKVEPPKPDPIPATAGPDCKTVASHTVTTIDAAALGDKGPAMVTLLEKRCTEDKWSDEARSCFATIQSDDEGQGCADGKLTEAQREAVKRDAGELLGEGNESMKKKEEGATGGAPKPDEKKGKGTTRGVTKKPKGGDPCQGGEVSSDPCQGGQ